MNETSAFRYGGLELRLATLSVVLVATLVGCTAQPRDFDVLLITLDTTRKSRLSVYDYDQPTSPNLEALAQRGTRFDKAFSTSALTPVAHASIMTGLNPYRHGMRVAFAASGDRLPDSVPTLASQLRGAGWSTGAFVSSFTTSEHYGLDQGFETWDSGIDSEVDQIINEHGGWNTGQNQRRADFTTDLFLEWLEQVEGPWFSWLHYWDPHDLAKRPPNGSVEPFHPRTYDGEIRWVDHQIGRVVETLQATERMDRTIIVILADHGEGLSDGLERHGWERHRILYQEQIDIPLILLYPGGPSGAAIDSPVRNIDVAPTVLDIIGLELPDDLDGTSLLPLLEGEETEPRIAYAEAPNLFDLNAILLKRLPRADNLYMVTDGVWKLIYRRTEPDDSELYNLENDPLELDNLFTRHPQQVRRLFGDLEARNSFIDDPFLGEGETEPDPETLERLRSLGYLD